jgi:hemolysin III
MGKPRYSVKEEIANSVSHGVGVALAIAALAVLVTLAARQGDPWRIVSFSVYGATLVFLYLASTLYHAFRDERVKAFFRLLDHSAIFLLIAGSYTPFTLVTLRGPWGWTIFGLIWGIGILGLVVSLGYTHRAPRWLLALIYIAMGWLVVIAIKPMLVAMALPGLLLLAAGGLLYTGGTIFYVTERIPYNHAIWHLFVLGGSICHFFCMLFYVLPA